MRKVNIRNDLILSKILALMKAEGVDIYNKKEVIKSLTDTVSPRQNIIIYTEFINNEAQHEKLTTCDSVR